MSGTTDAYTDEEMMVVAGAREIRDGELVFIGMRLPLLCYALAQARHAPRAIGLFESGLVRDSPPTGPIRTMGDLPNQEGALQSTSLLTVMGELSRGRVDLGFLGAGEIDRHGNLNSTWVTEKGRRIRLPGSGGACDIASLARRVVVILREEPRRIREVVSYLTSPGQGDGPGWRERVGLPPGGTVRVITQRAIYALPPPSLALTVESIHPGIPREDLAFASAGEGRVPETRRPDLEELAALRRFVVPPNPESDPPERSQDPRSL